MTLHQEGENFGLFCSFGWQGEAHWVDMELEAAAVSQRAPRKGSIEVGGSLCYNGLVFALLVCEAIPSGDGPRCVLVEFRIFASLS